MSQASSDVLSDLSLRNLIREAEKAMQLTYSPYSKFPVGAALLCRDGTIFRGCNVENASYGGTICAERTALVKAVSEGHKDFLAIGLACAKSPGSWPCGICRQFIVEFGTHILIVSENADGSLNKMTMSELLPKSFGPEDLS